MRSLLLALALVLAATAARAQTLSVTHSGYLLDSTDVPVNGPVQVAFKLYSHPTGSSASELVWQSDTCSVTVAKGFYAVVLGDACNRASDPLSATHLPPAQARYLELVIADTTLSPRMPINSVPTAVTAMKSLDAQKLEAALRTAGTLNADTNPVEWTTLKNVPAGLADGVDADTTYTAAANGGLALLDGAFAIAPGGVTNEMLKNPSLTVEAGAGLAGGGAVALGGTTSLSLADLSPSPAGTYNFATVTVDAKGRVTSAASGTPGTVSSVTAGAGLAGGAITTSGTIAIANDGVTNAMLANDGASLAKVSGSVMALKAAKIGIGTADPQFKLDVAGDLRANALTVANSHAMHPSQHEGKPTFEYPYAYTFTVNGDGNTFYPVAFAAAGNGTVPGKFVLARAYSEAGPTGLAGQPSTAHKGGLQAVFSTMNTAWADYNYLTLESLRSTYVRTIADCGNLPAASSGRTVWCRLRGGGFVYHVWANYPIDPAQPTPGSIAYKVDPHEFSYPGTLPLASLANNAFASGKVIVPVDAY